MWLCLNNAFFSIVDPKRDDDKLVVRARRKGDIERIFDVPGVYSPGRDYAYRAYLDRDVIAAVMMTLVLGLDYGNFKSSVKDDRLHRAYNRVWGVMGDLQEGGPYGQDLRRGKARGGQHRAHQRRLPMATEWPFHDLPAMTSRPVADGDPFEDFPPDDLPPVGFASGLDGNAR